MTSTVDLSTALGALLDGRFSCRAYKPESVDHAVIERGTGPRPPRRR